MGEDRLEQVGVVVDAQLVRHREQHRVGLGDRRVLGELFDEDIGLSRVRPSEDRPEAVDLYLAHFLGAKGAGDFLNAMQTDPDQAAAPLFPAAAAANRNIFYRSDGRAKSLNDIRNGFAAKMAAVPSSGRQVAYTTQQRFATTTARREPLAMANIEEMPKGLDLQFAQKAYKRLSGLTA